jgi:hypothetical protein
MVSECRVSLKHLKRHPRVGKKKINKRSFEEEMWKYANSPGGYG